MLPILMANEQEVRSRAQSEGLNQSQQNEAVQLAKNNPNLSVDQIIQQVRSK